MTPILAAAIFAAISCRREAPSQSAQSAQRDSSGEPAADPTAAARRSPKNDELRVLLLGTGTPVPDPRRSGPSVAMVVGRQAYLFDAGPGVVQRAAAAAAQGVAALAPTRLALLFVTHLHSDHTLGLADLMRTPAVVGRQKPLTVFGPPGIEAMVEHLQGAYAEDLRLRRRVGDVSEGYEATPHTVTSGLVYQDHHVAVRAFAVAHGSVDHAMGYRIDTRERSAVVSGDTAPSAAVVTACDGCDVLVHEAYCEAGLAKLPPSVQEYHRTHHTSGPQLAALATRARPKLLVLTHLLAFSCSEAALLAEVRDGYDGEVALGEDLGIY